jgi:hypothetical protein
LRHVDLHVGSDARACGTSAERIVASARLDRSGLAVDGFSSPGGQAVRARLFGHIRHISFSGSVRISTRQAAGRLIGADVGQAADLRGRLLRLWLTGGSRRLWGVRHGRGGWRVVVASHLLLQGCGRLGRAGGSWQLLVRFRSTGGQRGGLSGRLGARGWRR